MARPRKSKGGMSKMEAVRQALRELGPDAPIAKILPFIKERFNVVMSPEMAYNYKSTAKKQMRGGKRRGRKPGRKPAAAAANGRRTAAAGAAISLDDIQAVKTLVDRIGADKVRSIAAVLSK
jgi:hypothetical protein